jgi:hypothetical protein
MLVRIRDHDDSRFAPVFTCSNCQWRSGNRKSAVAKTFAGEPKFIDWCIIAVCHDDDSLIGNRRKVDNGLQSLGKCPTPLTMTVLIARTTNFITSLETGDTALTWTNTVDTTSPGGNESNVTSAVLQLTTTEMSHTGGHAIQYGGMASGGTSNYAYMEAFSNSTVLSSTSRLNYWIYPQSPLGAEPNASSTTGLNSTCVAVDIIFTDGTTLRGSTRTDQNWNLMHPAHQCNHLQPDHWNYVTSDLSPLSGKTVSRIDIGYDQPNAPAGSYRGYVDDISLTH